MRLNRLLASTIAAAGLLGAGVTAPADATSSSAPVIHESFKLLSCPSKPRTTLQIEGCAEHKVIALDKQIDALNAKIYAKLHKAGRADLLTSSGDWVTYRNAACTTETSIYAGGSIQPVAYANCLVTLDTAHVAELKTMLVALSPEG